MQIQTAAAEGVQGARKPEEMILWFHAKASSADTISPLAVGH